ncbi:hypothetical protein CBS147343_3106 [Aspergillus niger]|uniref:Uncharacterized protein n=1 Tax=Aspergillus niger (strain ATCC 1015 / CBS 113.46 / FGSC A1144 / LSHB Ac4 / NCTC 3858a / NRRL 328 / USDA 3528.7) TaxID=380704 RepID=G3YCU6_ASPNA|nr:hypothetical protein ASPNIDRAFT_178441 [Aspergillus niger ATCC 1015]KAI2886939.1 hypothetical protein CBS13152_6936 [Aspergillus niger]KAI2987934.1 hypothetical protein CBS147345_10783 [Aspergillus niger]KAI3025482.1 hypothetical protein CBS147482_1069 [Aspergillus niger]KAI3044863.1 hypothetical protein CBS76997_4943 [Aspergillus niger]
MRQGESTGITGTITSQGQFQTPDKPPRVRPATETNAAKAALARAEPSASSASTSRSWKRSSFPGLQDQPTLTQIDFVTPKSQDTGSDGDDDDLDYIDSKSRSRGRADPEVIEIDDDSENDADYQPPSHLKPKLADIRGVKFERGAKNAAPKPKKRSSQGGGDMKQKRRKAGEGSNISKKDKDKAKGHKTLTQMDYVRRYLKIEPDDDVKLDYTYITPKKNDGQDIQQTHSRNPESYQQQDDRQSRLNGRKAQEIKDEAGATVIAEATNNRGVSEAPVTPKKRFKREIPSSQSPESPGIAIITSSQFRGATHSPQKHVAAGTADRRIKEESPALHHIKEEPFQDSEPMLLFPNDILPESGFLESRVSHRHGTAHQPSVDQAETPTKPARLNSSPRLRDSKGGAVNSQRTVIYETDAESDYGDLENDLPDAPASPKSPEPVEGDPDATDDLDFDRSKDGSQDQDLPPMRPSELDLEAEPPLPEPNPTSEASIYYQRLQPATQFPLGTIPTLSSQKLAELFPEEPNDQQALRTMSPLPSSPRTDSRAMSKPCIPAFSQTQGQSSDKAPMEMVPESSPITRQGNGTRAKEFIPPEPLARRDVVQVESSQPADRHHKKNKEENSGPRGILSRSQILTSSVMESVPLPAFLMDSQDSVGEPYSLPDS